MVIAFFFFGATEVWFIHIHSKHGQPQHNPAPSLATINIDAAIHHFVYGARLRQQTLKLHAFGISIERSQLLSVLNQPYTRNGWRAQEAPEFESCDDVELQFTLTLLIFALLAFARKFTFAINVHTLVYCHCLIANTLFNRNQMSQLQLYCHNHHSVNWNWNWIQLKFCGPFEMCCKCNACRRRRRQQQTNDQIRGARCEFNRFKTVHTQTNFFWRSKTLLRKQIPTIPTNQMGNIGDWRIWTLQRPLLNCFTIFYKSFLLSPNRWMRLGD